MIPTFTPPKAGFGFTDDSCARTCHVPASSCAAEAPIANFPNSRLVISIRTSFAQEELSRVAPSIFVANSAQPVARANQLSKVGRSGPDRPEPQVDTQFELLVRHGPGGPRLVLKIE